MCKAICPFWFRWKVERQAADLDALFRTADALGHGGLGDQDGDLAPVKPPPRAV